MSSISAFSLYWEESHLTKNDQHLKRRKKEFLRKD